MGTNNGSDSRRAGLDPVSKIEAAFAAGWSNIWGFVRSEGDGGRCGLSVNCRGSRDWVAVLRASDSDGSPIVFFGNGESFTGAVSKLNATMAAGNSKPDKFATERAKAQMTDEQLKLL